MNKITMLKGVIGIVVSVGAGAIVGNAIKATTPANVKFITKACIAVSSLVISFMIGDAVVKYTEEQIDNGVNFVKNLGKTEESE